MSTNSHFFKSGQSIIDALGAPPEKSSAGQYWPGTQMYEWGGAADGVTFESCDEVVLILHRGGASKVPVRISPTGPTSISRPGLISIVPKNSKISWVVNGGVKSFTLHISDDHFPSALAARKVSERLIVNPELALADPYISSTLEILASEMAFPKADSASFAESAITTLGAYISRSLNSRKLCEVEEGIEGSVLQYIIETIDNEIEVGVSISQLSKLSGMNRKDFYRKFYNSMGVTPHKYITSRRVARAKNLLLTSKFPLSEIAYLCGFSTQPHFSDVFKRYVGVTPLAFRRGC